MLSYIRSVKIIPSVVTSPYLAIRKLPSFNVAALEYGRTFPYVADGISSVNFPDDSLVNCVCGLTGVSFESSVLTVHLMFGDDMASDWDDSITDTYPCRLISSCPSSVCSQLHIILTGPSSGSSALITT
jgi:hypothetical protein